jgi:hypothetical protein
VREDRCFKAGEGRTGFGLVNRGLGLRDSSSSTTPFLRPLCTVGRAVVVRRRFGLSQLISLGILNVCFDCVYARAHLDHNMYNEGKDKNEIYTEKQESTIRSISEASYQWLVWDLERALQGECVGKMCEQGWHRV